MRRVSTIGVICPLVLLVAGCSATRLTSAPLKPDAAPDTTAAQNVANQPAVTARDAAILERTAQLQAQLAERDREISQLQSEVQQLRDRETDLHTALARATKGRREKPAASGAEPAAGNAPTAEDQTGAATTPDSPAAGRAGTTVAALRAQLSEERQRRERVEAELARLKEETATPALAPENPTQELASARHEIGTLRSALADERDARAKLAAQFDDLERRAVQGEHPADPQDADLRWRLQSLQAEKEAIVDSFTQSLAASQQHATELEQELASRSQTDTARVDGSPALQTENTALRARLDEEHRRTEDLAKKLKIAARVTDLIFKMRAQQSSAVAVQAGPLNEPPALAAP